MRIVRTIVLVTVAAFALLSCNHPAEPSAVSLLPELQQAEAIMYASPDSALRLLQSMPVPQPSDRLQYATWALFTTQARYKLYMQQSDSLINIACDYFLKQGDAQRRALALYCKGAICKEQQQIEEAHTYFLQAAEEVEKTTDNQLGYLIYGGLADTYAYQDLSEYALKAAEQSYLYADREGDSRYIASALIVLARINSTSSNFTNAAELYKKAIVMANGNKRYQVANGATTELIGIYCLLGELDSVRYYTKQFLSLQEEHNLCANSAQYSVLGEAYRLMNKTDSAYFYLKRAIETSSGNMYIQRGIYRRLLDLSQEKNDYKNATIYGNKLIECQDSIYLLDKSKEIVEIQEKYNQQKLINEKNALTMKKDAVVRNALIGLAAALLLIAVLVYAYQKKLLRKERRIQEAEEEIRSKSVRIQENEQTINLNRKRMQELEEQMAADKGMQEELEEQRKALAEIGRQNERLEEENRHLQCDIDGMSATLKEKSVELAQLDALSKENLRLHDREWYLSSLLLENDETLRSLKQSPRYIRDEEWAGIKRSIDRLFDHFTRRLVTAIPSLTENELQLCCLIKLHFSNPAIASMLAIESASVSKRKFRLKERIIQQTGGWSSGTTLELWLWNF